MGNISARLAALARRIISKPARFAAAAGFVALVVMMPMVANAQIADAVAGFFAGIILAIASFLGKLTLTLIGLLIEVAQYNDFINAEAVRKGWVIVRDISNMFFIVILLLIAFGSVFRIEEYQYKKLLGKLLIMAVLVNFSKAITGFFIDIAQVVMLTFVNGFKEAAAGNFVQGFHLAEIFKFAEAGTGEAEGTSFLFAAMLALITILITTVVVAVYLLVFLIRIVALWFLTIISPIAYVLSAFPGDAKKYSSMWWDQFGKYATTGPILAFFLWLSLAVMQFSSNALGTSTANQAAGVQDLSIPAAAITQIGQSEVLLSFIVNIILLMGGLWMTQQLGVAGGQLAAKATNLIKKGGMAPIAGIAAVGGWAGGRLWGTAKYEYSKFTTGLMEGHGGKEPGKLRKAAFAVLNAPASVRGWEARTKELEHEQKEIATAYGREITEQFRTRGKLKLPYSTFIERRAENEYMKEYQNMSKEQFMHAAVGLEKMGGVEGERRKRAVVKAAASQGYLDDLMRMPQFANKYGIGNTVYNEKTLNRFLYGYLGHGRESMRFMDQDMDTLGKQTRHWEYLGHAQYDPNTGSYSNTMEEVKDSSGNVIDMNDKGQRAYAIGELKKMGGRDIVATAPHNEVSQVAERYEADEVDEKGNAHKKGDFKLSEEGTVDVKWGISEGGRTDFQKSVSEVTSAFSALREKQHSQQRLKYILLSEEYDDMNNEVVVHNQAEFDKIKLLYDEMPAKMTGMFQLLSRKEKAQGFVVRYEKSDGTVERRAFGNYKTENDPDISTEVSAQMDQSGAMKDIPGSSDRKTKAVAKTVTAIRETEVTDTEQVKKRLMAQKDEDGKPVFRGPEEPKDPKAPNYREELAKYERDFAEFGSKMTELAGKIVDTYVSKRAEFLELDRYLKDAPSGVSSADLGVKEVGIVEKTIRGALKEGFSEAIADGHAIGGVQMQEAMINRLALSIDNLIRSNNEVKGAIKGVGSSRNMLRPEVISRIVRGFLPSKIEPF